MVSRTAPVISATALPCPHGPREVSEASGGRLCSYFYVGVGHCAHSADGDEPAGRAGGQSRHWAPRMRQTMTEVASFVDEHSEGSAGAARFNELPDTRQIPGHAIQAPEHDRKLARQGAELSPVMRGFVLKLGGNQNLVAGVSHDQVGASGSPQSGQHGVVVERSPWQDTVGYQLP
jgi:hypothetical protein